jgi:hypothetical protein
MAGTSNLARSHAATARANASSDGHPFDPPMILPYSLREFLFRSGLRDGGDQYERIVDDNTALHEMDHQHRLQKDRRTPYEWPRGVDEEDERKRILFEKTKEDILQQMRTMVDPEYAGVADALRSARQGNKKTSQFADWEDFPPHIQRIADAQIKDAYDSIYRPDYRNTRRRPAYVFAPGIYEDLIAHLNKTSDAFVSPDGKKKPTNTPVEQSAHLIGTHLLIRKVECRGFWFINYGKVQKGLETTERVICSQATWQMIYENILKKILMRMLLDMHTHTLQARSQCQV